MSYPLVFFSVAPFQPSALSGVVLLGCACGMDGAQSGVSVVQPAAEDTVPGALGSGVLAVGAAASRKNTAQNHA